MKNIIYFNSDFEPLLLVNEENSTNSIYLDVETDDTTNQLLRITVDSTSTDISLTSSAENIEELETTYWNLGSDTTIQLYKNGTASNSITLDFPEVVDTDASLYLSSGVYTMQGSDSEQEQIDALAAQVATNTENIADNTTSITDLTDNKQNFIDQDLLVPTGTAEEGDLIFYGTNGTSSKKLYRYENSAWVEVKLGTDIEYGTDDPTGGEDGDVYIQTYDGIVIEYYSANQWKHDSFSVNAQNEIDGMTMSGNGANVQEYVCYKLSQLISGTTYTISCTGQFSSNATFMSGVDWTNGILASDSFVFFSTQSQVTIPYIAFQEDTNANNYTLTFTATGTEMLFWFQFGQVTDGIDVTFTVTNFSVSGGTVSNGDLIALWQNQEGTWNKGTFGGSSEEFTGATASTAGKSGLVPAPSAGDNTKYLRGDGTWHTVSGGGGITRTLLWSGSLANVGDAGTLSDAFSNYDFLLAYYMPSDMSYEYHIELIDCTFLKDGLNNGAGWFSFEYYDTIYIRLKFTSTTVFSVTGKYSSSVTVATLKYIYGINL